MQQLARLVDVFERVRLATLLKPKAKLLEAPKRDDDGVGKLLENAGKDFASALTGELRRLGERRIFIAMDILRELSALRGIFLRVKHKPFKSRLLGEPSDIRHIFGIVRPAFVIVPIYAIIPARRHPKEKHTFGKIGLLGDLLQVREMLFDLFSLPALGAMHNLRMAGRNDIAAFVDDRSFNADGNTVKVRRMLGELIGVCENIGRGSFENVEKEPHVFLVESARCRKFFRAVALDRIRRRYDACHQRTHRSGHHLHSHLFYPFFVFNENHILL